MNGNRVTTVLLIGAPIIPSWYKAPGTAEAIEEAGNRIINKSFNVFDGIPKTNDGRTIGEAGLTLADSEITGNMNWYYHNVEEN
jgi:basic membrane protein A